MKQFKSFAALLLLLPSTIIAAPAAAALDPACLPGGDQQAINTAFKLGGKGTVVNLCANAIFNITDTIRFTAPNQQLRSDGGTWFYNPMIQPAPGSDLTTLIESQDLNNITIYSVAFNGTRTGLGPVANGGATVNIGGKTSLITLYNVGCFDPRGSSCIRVYGANGDCKGATVSDSGIWMRSAKDADGLVFECANSYVYRNTIQGFAGTGSGISILGAAASSIFDNRLVSSFTYAARVGISMTDYHYVYDDVYVFNNRMKGLKLLHTGIAVGSGVFSTTSASKPPPVKGYAVISNNRYSTRLAFLVALNGWSGPLESSENGDVIYDVHYRASLYTKADNCNAVIKDALEKQANNTYWPGGVADDQLVLRDPFYPLKGDPQGQVDCTIPDKGLLSFKRGEFNMPPNKEAVIIADFYGSMVAYTGRGSIRVSSVLGTDGSDSFGSNVSCGEPAGCSMKFDNDGDLVVSNSTGINWRLGTKGKGETFEIFDRPPWARILDKGGKEIWNTGIRAWYNEGGNP